MNANPTTGMLLKALQRLILDGTLTKAKCVDEQTFVCFSNETVVGKQYTQSQFEELPKVWKELLQYRTAGEIIGPVKVLAVFDIWMPETSTTAKPLAS